MLWHRKNTQFEAEEAKSLQSAKEELRALEQQMTAEEMAAMNGGAAVLTDSDMPNG